MNVFVVHAHPEPKSFCSALYRLACTELTRLGHDVRCSDLYEMNFNPVASAADFSQRKDPDYLVYALEQRHAQARGGLPDDVQGEIDKLLWCDLLILNFPVFWFAPPAVLKGWIDRVFVSGLIYGGKRFYDRGGLVGKKALVTMTLGGRRHMFADDGIHGPIQDMFRPLLRGTLAYAGMTVLPPFVAYHVPYVDDQSRRELLNQYSHQLSQLEHAEPLRFPSLAAFDDEMYPLSRVASE